MAAMVDGHCTAKERAVLLEHCDRCPSCYQEWLSMSALQSGAMERNAARPVMARMWKGGLSLAIAASLLLVLWQAPRSDRSELLLASAYQDAASLKIVADRAKRKDRGGGGMVSASDPDEFSGAKRAFLAGSRHGLQLLTGGDKNNSLPANSTGDHHFFRLGQWSALLKVMCAASSKVPEELWRAQEKIGLAMVEEWASKPEDIAERRLAHASVAKLLTVLTNPDVSEGHGQECSSIYNIFSRLESDMR
ncbi:MAG: hypothetical protein HQL96_08070 [Magnetococcales bacterium]|nr:hypothetical protein [Magnetococcales bacterium]